MQPVQRSAFAALLAVAALALAGCGESTPPPTPPATPPASTVPSDGGQATQGNDDRAFNSTDDAVIQAVEEALHSDNAQARWEGSVLHISLDGSADAVTAYLPCSAAEVLLADGEEVILEYPDGEYICADRPS